MKTINLLEFVRKVSANSFVKSIELTNENHRNNNYYIRIICDIEMMTIKEFKDYVEELSKLFENMEVHSFIENGVIRLI